MVETILETWTIVLVILATVLIMTIMTFLLPAVVLLLRMRSLSQISLDGTV
uniref:Uncharacterized protein n=1 Tax=Pseudonaja textilis TaxID=8673 RepID=A0A670Z2X3_PSETE